MLPAHAHAPTIGVVARHTEDAVLAGARGRPVCTVLVDTSDPHDPSTQMTFASSGLRAAHVVLTLPDAGWGAAVERGLHHAQQLGAAAVVLADPELPADLDAPAPESRVAAALGRLAEQARPGVVCCPLAAPWWQRLLAIHVLRPLCAPALGLTLVDPRARTLILSADAVHAAVALRGRLASLAWAHGHGLGIVAAARHTGLDIDQALPRLPDPDAVASWMTRPVLDRAEALSLLSTALRLAPLDPPRHGAPVTPWVNDLGLAYGQLAPPAVLKHVLAQCAAQARLGWSNAAGGWPEPLVAAWHHARELQADHEAIAERLWLAYLTRLVPWLRTTASSGGYTAHARASVVAAARQFLAATATPIAVECGTDSGSTSTEGIA